MNLLIDMNPILHLMLDISDIDHKCDLLTSIFNFLIKENDKDDLRSLSDSFFTMDYLVQSNGIDYKDLDFYIKQINSIIYNFTAIVHPIYLYSKRIRSSLYMLRIENETSSIN